MATKPPPVGTILGESGVIDPYGAGGSPETDYTSEGLYRAGAIEEFMRPTEQEAESLLYDQHARSSVFGAFFSDEAGTFARKEREVLLSTKLQYENAPRISAEEANKKYPGLNIAEPIYDEVAAIRYKERQRQDSWNAYLSKTPLSWWDQTKVGLQAGAMDPLQIGLGLATGGATKYLGLATTGIRGLGIALTSNFAEQAAVNLMKREQLVAEGDAYSIGDALGEATGGALVGTAFHYAGAALVKGAKSAAAKTASRVFKNQTPDAMDGVASEVKAKAVIQAIAQHETGKPINVAAMIGADQSAKIGVATPSFKASPGELVDQPMFLAIDKDSKAPIKLGEHSALGDTYISSGEAANNLGHVRQSALDGKYLDLESPIDGPNGKVLQDILKTITKGDVPITGSTVGDLLREVRLQSFEKSLSDGAAPFSLNDELVKSLKAAGYDGVKYDIINEGKPATNAVTVFDSAHPRTIDEFTHNPEGLAIAEKMRTDTTQTVTPPEVTKNIKATTDDALRIKETLDTVITDSEATRMGKLQDATLSQRAKTTDDPVVKDFIEEGLTAKRKLDEKVKQHSEALQTLTDCFIKGTV